jgi:hypothetical protein
MNERIEQLAVRAGATLEKGYIELSDGQFMLSDNIDLDKTNLDLEKFAELLIQECCEVINAAKPGVDQLPPEVALDMAAKNVKAYFGV